jgi:hypothetical protein
MSIPTIATIYNAIHPINSYTIAGGIKSLAKLIVLTHELNILT